MKTLMEADERISRGRIAYSQGRFQAAEKEFRGALTQRPRDAAGHALLALAILALGQVDEAEREARAAIECEPDAPGGYFALAHVLRRQRRLGEAIAAAEESRAYNPLVAAPFELLAMLQAERADWASSLAAAEAGLAVAPAHVPCRTARGIALTELGRARDAVGVLRATLADAPESAEVHEAFGRALVRSGQAGEAVRHLREALRLNPMSESASQGFAEALKSRNTLYRWVVDLELRILRSKRRSPAVFIALGLASLGFAVLSKAGVHLPAFVAYAAAPPLLFLLARPYIRAVFDLTLRFDPIGRHALSPDERAASLWGCAALFATAACAGVGAATGELLWAFPAIGAFVFGMHAIGVHLSPSRKLRRTRVAVMVGTALVGAAGVAAVAVSRGVGGTTFCFGLTLCIAAAGLFVLSQLLDSVAEWDQSSD